MVGRLDVNDGHTSVQSYLGFCQLITVMQQVNFLDIRLRAHRWGFDVGRGKKLVGGA
jgi:hypothetical protein